MKFFVYGRSFVNVVELVFEVFLGNFVVFCFFIRVGVFEDVLKSRGVVERVLVGVRLSVVGC